MELISDRGDGEVMDRDPVVDTARAIFEAMTALAYPVDFDVETNAKLHGNEKYTPVMHATLCRLMMLGLEPAAAAAAAGVHKSTVQAWLNKFPKLAHDLEQARQLANASAMLLLRKFMLRDDSDGLAAIRFFLDRRTKEFRPRQVVEVESEQDAAAVARSIRANVYGIIDEPDASRVADEGDGQGDLARLAREPGNDSSTQRLKGPAGPVRDSENLFAIEGQADCGLSDFLFTL